MKNIAYHIMRVFVLFMVVATSLAFYRSTIQPSYHWSLLIIEGTGMTGHYINIGILFIISWLSFLLINWYRRKWYYIFPLTLTLVSFYATVQSYLQGSDMTFNGDALNIHIDLGIGMALITFIALIATMYWSYKDYKNFKSITLKNKTTKFKILIAVGISLTFIALYMFSFGNGVDHITADRIAVMATITQGFVFYYITKFGLYKPS